MSQMFMTIFAFAIVCSDYVYAQVDAEVDGRRPHNRIVGGRKASIDYFPYQAGIVFVNYVFICGGSIVGPRHVLTAAHCQVNMPFLTVHVGAEKWFEGRSYAVIQGVEHPNWSTRNENELFMEWDVAVLILELDIVFGPKVQTIPLPTGDLMQRRRRGDGVLSGWGSVSTLVFTASDDLQYLAVNVFTKDECMRLFKAKHFVHALGPTQICAMGLEPEQGACVGDSGGPLVADGVQIGIVSYAPTGSCAPGIPDVYTNVFGYMDFIALHVAS